MPDWQTHLMPDDDTHQLDDNAVDVDLVTQARNGRSQAFDLLMRRHSPMVVRYLTRLLGNMDDAQDAAQETFVALHRNLHRFDPNRPFVAWLFHIARNKGRDALRKRTAMRWLGGDDSMEQLASTAPAPDIEVSDRQTLGRVDALFTLIAILWLAVTAFAIPIVLHFLSRRQLDEVPFATLRFLKPTQERQMRRLHLRRLLLLFLRVAIIVSIVIAMARPTLTGGLAGLVRSGEGASVVLLVDASASMRAQMTGGTVFDAARDVAGEIADELSGDDEVAVMLFHDGVQPLFGEFVRDPGLVLAELAEIEPSYRGSDYMSAIEAAMDMLDRGTKSHREIYVIGDFQRVEMDTLRVARFETELAAALPTNIFLRPIAVEPFVNRAVERVERPVTLLRSGQTADVAAVVRQTGGEDQASQLFLQVDGSSLGESELQLTPGAARRHVFPLTLPDAGDLGGSVRLRPDRYPVDDERFFALRVGEQVPALVLAGFGGLEGERDPMLFLAAALDPSGRGDGAFELTVSEASSLDVEELQRSHVVVGSDVRGLGAARLAALDDYLHDGGTMLLFVGDPRVRAYTNEKLLPQWTELRLGAFRDAEDTHERLEIVSRDHSAFAGFENDELATLREVQFRNFYRLPEDRGRVLIRYIDGGAAVVELEVGRGRLILCGFHTSASAGDLPYSPMFLPLIQRLTGYLATAGWGRFGSHFEVGQTLVMAAPEGVLASDRIELSTPDGRIATAILDESASLPRVEFDAADVPGIYEFEHEGRPWAVVAVNSPGSESRREFFDANGLRDALGESGNASYLALEGESTGVAVREARKGIAIHRWFLVLAGILLMIESLLSRRIGPSTA